MRTFHKLKNHYHCPIINLDKIWTLVGEEVRCFSRVRLLALNPGRSRPGAALRRAPRCWRAAAGLPAARDGVGAQAAPSRAGRRRAGRRRTPCACACARIAP
jgi:hypothetical protein